MMSPILEAKIGFILGWCPDLTPQHVQEMLDEIEEKIRFANLSTLYDMFYETGEFIEGKGFVKKRDAFYVHLRHRIKERFTQICMSITGSDRVSVEQSEDLIKLIDKIREADELSHFMKLPLYSLIHRLRGNA